MGGALIGGTVDSTGAVTVAGTALGETAQTAAVLVKSIQNILIGFIAFAVAVFFATKVENNGESSRKIGASEIYPWIFCRFLNRIFYSSSGIRKRDGFIHQQCTGSV